MLGVLRGILLFKVAFIMPTHILKQPNLFNIALNEEWDMLLEILAEGVTLYEESEKTQITSSFFIEPF